MHGVSWFAANLVAISLHLRLNFCANGALFNTWPKTELWKVPPYQSCGIWKAFGYDQ